jgi:methylase of polypeptide subunit release factors
LHGNRRSRVDLLLANPPYVPSGSDGLNVIREILRCSARLPRPGGSLGIEHGEDQRETVMDHRDQQHRPLYITAIRNRQGWGGKATIRSG